jgi:hypothetical protein
VQNVSGSGQLPLITIEAVPTAEPTRVIASTVISVFVSGSGVAGTVPVSNVPGPDGASFAVYVASGNATRGGDAISVQIGITRTGSFTGPVDFSLASALPAGMIVSFNEKSVAGSQNFVFVRAAASTPVGTYDLVIDAVTVIRRTPLTIRVVVV